MNAKLCKRLRREARELSIGMPERRLLINKRGSLINYRFSTRGIYRSLKASNRAARASRSRVP